MLKCLKCILIVDCLIEFDNGIVVYFEGYCVQYNVLCGLGKGGVCYYQDVMLLEVMVLLVWMLVKNVVVNVLYGGVKGGICVDLCKLLCGEFECVMCCYISEIGIIIGLNIDILVLDVNINEQVMVWMMDMYLMNQGQMLIGVVIGKLILFGGLFGCKEVMGCGVFVVGLEVVKKKGFEIEGVCIVVQGFGNVGGIVVKLFQEVGVKVIVVQDYMGMIYQLVGFDLNKLFDYVVCMGGVVGFEGVELMLNDEFWMVEIDILILVVLENQIIEKNVVKICMKIIVEGVNGLMMMVVDDILSVNGVLVIFDVIVNVGGVIVLYFEWVQDFLSFFWMEDEINYCFECVMCEVFVGVWVVVEEYKVMVCMVVFIVVCKCILMVCEMCGFYF